MFRILLAEDNPGDIVLFREALKERGLPCDLQVAADGLTAISLVRDTPRGSAPHLVVLDVNLPKHNGDEVLQVIRSEAAFSGVPVIMLTSSAAPMDEAKAGGLGADMYVQKPSDLAELREIGTMIERLLKRAG